MARGPAITQDEINKAHALKAEGKGPKEIALKLQRTLATVYKMLAATPQ
jgi:hypothetical protein